MKDGKFLDTDLCQEVLNNNNKGLKMKIYSTIGVLLVNFLITGFVYAGNYDNTSKEWQIKTYSSAAPDFIGNFATIIGADGKVLKEGSNGWTCMAGNGRP